MESGRGPGASADGKQTSGAMRRLAVAAICVGMLPLGARGADAHLRASADTPGIVFLLRHASAPGSGDPPGFLLDDCATQRNLSPAGVEEAVRIGAALRAAGVAGASVFSSRWCRCLDTAQALALGPVTPLSALDSFYASPAERVSRTAALHAWLDQADLRRPMVLVTHQVNITALTGVVPAQGELLAAQRDGAAWRVVARHPLAPAETSSGAR